MKRVTALMIVLLVSAITYAAANPLIGAWELDRNKTLSAVAQGPTKIRTCYEKNFCGNFRIEFKNTLYRVVAHSSDGKSELFTQEFRPYKVLSVTKEFVKTEEKDENGKMVTTEWFIHEEGICQNLTMDGFTYAECFKMAAP